MKKVLINILCAFIPSKKLRHILRNNNFSGRVYFSLNPYVNKGKNNRIIIIKDGNKRKLSRFEKIKGLKVFFKGDDNLIEIEYPFHPGSVNIYVHSYYGVVGKNNKCYIGKCFSGNVNIAFHTCDSTFKCGKSCIIGSCYFNLVHNSVYIDDDCLMSDDIIFQGDGHSIVDYETGEVLNKPRNVCRIGNHCWIGYRTTFLKGAEIPDDCVVAFGSIVTKKFDKLHCVIAGNPAKIVKENISWNGMSPCYYDENNLKEQYKKYK